MINLYDKSKASVNRKLECDGLLFVEYQCPVGAVIQDLWAQYGHFVFMTSGRKIWLSTEGELPMRKGEALYCRKGAYLVHNIYEEDVCILLFFIPEEFIREIVFEYRQNLNNNLPVCSSEFQVLKLEVDLSLRTFFESVMSYFFQDNSPSEPLLKLKFKELVLQVLTSNSNSELAHYFLSLANEERTNLQEIMRHNYLFNLSVEDYARLCNRSLSSFKRDFSNIFGMPPGKWLVEQRLKYAKMRILTTDESINDVAFHSGFETTSHFIRCFKKQFGAPPKSFRQKSLAGNAK